MTDYEKEALDNTAKKVVKDPIKDGLENMYQLGYKHGYNLAKLEERLKNERTR